MLMRSNTTLKEYNFIKILFLKIYWQKLQKMYTNWLSSILATVMVMAMVPPFFTLLICS